MIILNMAMMILRIIMRVILRWWIIMITMNNIPKKISIFKEIKRYVHVHHVTK